MTPKQRAENNKRVLEKWRAGDSLATSTPEDTWWPNRSKGFIKKDPEAMKKLYKVTEEKEDDTDGQASERQGD